MTDRASLLARRRALRLGAGALALAAAPSVGARAAAVYRTPGVYIEERSAFPNSVVEVATAVPAFVGYTGKAENGRKPLRDRPWRISSLAEFTRTFGGLPTPQFEVQPQAPGAAEPPDVRHDGKVYGLARTDGRHLLPSAMRLFFANGGGSCTIVSVGSTGEPVTAEALRRGIDRLSEEPEPSLLVVPDAVLLAEPDTAALQQAMLAHCARLRSRFAILDVRDGFRRRDDPAGDPVRRFRNGIGVNDLQWGAAYYPWLETSVVDSEDVSLDNVAGLDLLGGRPVDGSPLHKALLGAMLGRLNRLPPAAALAGIYTKVDNSRGVWKAPANVSVNMALAPSVAVAAEQQEELSQPLDGKAVNAIRPFVGEGTLVWGARTLDGNSLDWRYVNVRRTMIMIEQSIMLAIGAYVFEPNDANTWATIKSMIQSFLTSIWKRGGLAGAVPEDAFSVHAGLGETMTPVDILDGILRVTVLVAATRPAEFIEITFQQQMQKG